MTQGVGGRGETADDLTPPGAPAAAGSAGAPGRQPSGAGATAPHDVPRPALPPVFAPRSFGAAPSGVVAPVASPLVATVESTAAPEGLDPEPPPAPDGGPHAGPGGRRRRTVRRAWRPVAILLTLSTLLLAAGVVYLWRTSDAWQHRAQDYESANRDLGVRVADERARLDATNTDLEAVRAQLSTAQSRIIELANEKAQLGDDREAQRMLADYQQRISDAAATVAEKLDQCVQGQNRLIGYLRNASLYDPKDLDAYSKDVQTVCQAATDANAVLQGELSR